MKQNEIISPKNDYIKSICRLHTSAGRRESGLFLVEGHKLCHEVLRSNWEIVQCLVTQKESNKPFFEKYNGDITYISEAVSQKISTMDTAPGIYLIVRQKQDTEREIPKQVLALDHIADPTNLGAILRSAEAFGVELVYLSEGCVDIYSPKVLRAAMGSAFRVPFRYGSLEAFLTQQKEDQKIIYGAGLDRNYKELPDISFDHPSVVVIGNESNGISARIMDLCDQGLFIPMLGENESLNAAVAASIILWEQSKWK